MVKQKTLNADSGALLFEVLENGWTSVDFQAFRVSHRLGSDSKEIIINKFLIALSKPSKSNPSGEIDGIEVSHVLSLMELGGSVYASRDLKSFTLFFQNRSAEIIGKLELSIPTIESWIEELEIFRTDSNI